MVETLFIIDGILFIISIFALAFFCAVLPKTNIAKYFYILFGVTTIPIGIKFVLEGEEWYLCIWPFIFAVVGIAVGIGLFKANKKISKEEQQVLDRNFGKMARRSGASRVAREIWKNK